MLTEERLAALTAVAERRVRVRKINAPGSPRVFEPREFMVELGFLSRAEMIYDDGSTVHLTERGEHALAGSSA